MNEWWYSVDGSKNGPVSTNELKTLLIGRKITCATLVWREGLAAWVPFSEVDELRPLSNSVPPEPPPINPNDRGQLAALPLAGPWRRLLARMIDGLVLGFPVWLLFEYAITTQFPAIAPMLQEPGAAYLVGWFLHPFSMATEAAIFALFGSTLGKALLGVKVINLDGQRISGKNYLARQLRVYWYGLGTGFPLITLFTIARQHRRVKAGHKASYDEGLYSVKGKQIGIFRVIFVSIAYLLLCVATGELLQIIRSSYGDIYLGNTWKNEVTGSTVVVPVGWTYRHGQNTEGHIYHMFSSPDNGIDMVFAKEDTVPGIDLGTYVPLWMAAVSNKMVLFPNVQETIINGREAVNISGHLKEDQTRKVSATVVQKNREMWRLVVVASGGQSPQSDVASKLKGQIFDSID